MGKNFKKSQLSLTSASDANEFFKLPIEASKEYKVVGVTVMGDEFKTPGIVFEGVKKPCELWKLRAVSYRATKGPAKSVFQTCTKEEAQLLEDELDRLDTDDNKVKPAGIKIKYEILPKPISYFDKNDQGRERPALKVTITK